MAKALPTLSNAPVPPITNPAGSDGIAAPGGYLIRPIVEKNPKLQGQTKWIEYDSVAVNTAIVATALRIWTDLAGTAKWSATANPKGGKDAERAVQIVTEGLLEATLPKKWRAVVRKQSVKKFRGFALHEKVARKRPDGMWVLAELGHRPQWSVVQWDKPDERTPWQGVLQRTKLGGEYYIPRERLFYSVEDAIDDSPDGVGILRSVVELAETAARYRQLEGIGFDGDLRGMPVARAPISKIRSDAEAKFPGDAAAQSKYLNGQIQFLVDILDNYVKVPNQSLLLDSKTHEATGGDKPTITSVYQYGFELVQSSSSSMPELRSAIDGLTRDIARLMNAEWLLMGDGDGGSNAMHGGKLAMFAMAINSTVQDIVDDAQRDIVPWLLALNGLDPETCAPSLEAASIKMESVIEACQALLLLAQAGAPLRPNDEAVDVIRDRLELPPQPEVTDASLMIPRRPPLIGREAASPTAGEVVDSTGAPARGAADAKSTKLTDQVLPGGTPDAKPTPATKRKDRTR